MRNRTQKTNNGVFIVSSSTVPHPILYLVLMIATLFIPLAISQAVNIYLSSDFWNLIYVVDARVIDVKGSHIMIEVNRSWTEYAEPGDILTFSVPISGHGFQRVGMITRPPQLPFSIGESYLLLSEQGRLQGFGVEGIGFYRLKGLSEGSWGGDINPSIISLAELDSLAVHIGNDPGFDSRKWIDTIAFPSGERISVQELNEYCTSNGSDNKRESTITFHLQNNSLHVDRPFSMPYSRTRHIRFFSVVDSADGSRFFRTFIPRGPVMSTQWVIKWLRGRDLSFAVPVLECVSTEDNNIPEPVNLEFSGLSMILNLSEGAMVFNFYFPRIPFQDGPISLVFRSSDSLGQYSSRLPSVMLQFPELEYEPGIPEVFTIETALCRESEIPICFLYSDSLNGKFYPAFRFSISLEDSIRSSL